MTRLSIRAVHDRIGITPDQPGYGKTFGPRSKAALLAYITNTKAPALTADDFQEVGERLGVPAYKMRAVRAVEAPRGPYDDHGRPSILYERHVASRNTVPPGDHDAAHPALFGRRGYGAGNYGAYDAQYDRLLAACVIDPDAALKGCSWGAFQVLGENAEAMHYADVLDMVKSLVVSERGHLECFARFVEMKNAQDELRACRPGDPASCVPFVSLYNGKGFRAFNYHLNFAEALEKYAPG
jgi:pimeloyl-ACP methyl ester carboxylesterase